MSGAAEGGSWIDGVLGLDVVDLAQPLDASTPGRPGTLPFRSLMLMRHGDHTGVDGVSAANDLLLLTGHTGTHVDAVGHISYDDCVHGGASASEEQRGGALRTLGIDRIDRFLYRGVMLDVAALHGVDALEGGTVVSAADLDAAAIAARIDDLAGSAVLVRTGWGAEPIFHSSVYDGVQDGIPGIDLDAARLLAERGAAVVGSDTLAVERLAPGRPVAFDVPVHRFLLAERGVPLVENLNLEQLSARGIAEFVFVMAPLPISGGTGSPFRPLALVGPRTPM